MNVSSTTQGKAAPPVSNRPQEAAPKDAPFGEEKAKTGTGMPPAQTGPKNGADKGTGTSAIPAPQAAAPALGEAKAQTGMAAPSTGTTAGTEPTASNAIAPPKTPELPGAARKGAASTAAAAQAGKPGSQNDTAAAADAAPQERDPATGLPPENRAKTEAPVKVTPDTPPGKGTDAASAKGQGGADSARPGDSPKTAPTAPAGETDATGEQPARALAAALEARGQTLNASQKQAVQPYVAALGRSDDALVAQATDGLAGKETSLPVSFKAAPEGTDFRAATDGDTVYVGKSAARGGAPDATATQKADYADTLREEIAEAAFQKAFGTHSRGDFGAEVTARMNGSFDSLSGEARAALRTQSDSVTFRDGDRTVEAEARGPNTRTGNAKKNILNSEGLEGSGVTLDGKGGNDKLFGSRLNDRLYGGDGTDTIRGYAGEDFIQTGGTGDDVVYAGADNDTIQILRGEKGTKLILGEGGTDTVELKDVRRKEANVSREGPVTVVKFGGYTVRTRGVEKLAFEDRTVQIDPGPPVSLPKPSGSGNGRSDGKAAFKPVNGNVVQDHPRDFTSAAQTTFRERAEVIGPRVANTVDKILDAVQDLDKLQTKNLNDYPSSSNELGDVLNAAKTNVSSYTEFVGDMANTLDKVNSQFDALERNKNVPLGLRQELLGLVGAKIRQAYARVQSGNLGPALWNSVRNDTVSKEKAATIADIFSGITIASAGIGAFTGIPGILTGASGGASAIAGVGFGRELVGAVTAGTSFTAINGVPNPRNLQGSGELDRAISLSKGLPTLINKMYNAGLNADANATSAGIARGANEARDFLRQVRVLMDSSVMSKTSSTSKEHKDARERIGSIGYNVYSTTTAGNPSKTFYIEAPNAARISPAYGDTFAGSRAISVSPGKIKPGDHMPHTRKKGDWSGKILGNDPTTRGDPDTTVRGRYYLVAGYWRDSSVEVRNVNGARSPSLRG